MCDRIAIPSYVSLVNRTFQERYLKIFETSFEKANLNMLKLEENARFLIKEDTNVEKIPLITHKIWLTNDDDPFEIPDHTIHLLINGYNSCPKDWKHIFWTNDISLIPKTFEKLSSVNNLEVKYISEFLQDDNPIVWLISAYLKQKMIPFSCDLLRLLIVNKYGGFYMDIGWSINNYFSDVVKNFDYVFNTENCGEQGIVSHNLIGCKKENFVLTYMINFINAKNRLKEFYQIDKIGSLLELSGPRLITSIFGSLVPLDTRLLLLHESSFTYSRYHHRSWVTGETKFGINATARDFEEFEKDLRIKN